MTGLVYKHMPLSALPIGYDEIIYLPTVKVIEEVIYEDISYKIIPNKEINLSDFSLEELSVLETVATTFKNYKAREIVNYMHEEKAYTDTAPYQIIPYSWHSQSTRLLWTLYLGLNYLICEETCKEDCQDILNFIFDYFEKYLSPQIWQLSLDDILLDEVLYALGYLSAKLDNSYLQRLLSLTESPKISSMRKLIVYLSSYESFLINKENALKILNSNTFLLQLEKDIVPRLKWIADVLKEFESENIDEQTVNIIGFARKRILEILTS